MEEHYDAIDEEREGKTNANIPSTTASLDSGSAMEE